MPRSDGLGAWQAESFRLTVFPAAPADPAGWWRLLTGRDADSVSSQRNVGLHREQGVHDGHVLALRVQQERVDWGLGPNMVVPEEEIERAPWLGPLSPNVEVFRDLMARWLPQCPTPRRLAF